MAAVSALLSSVTPSSAFSLSRIPNPIPSRLVLRVSARFQARPLVLPFGQHKVCWEESKLRPFGFRCSRKEGVRCATAATEQDVDDSADKEDLDTEVAAGDGSDDDGTVNLEEEEVSAVISSLQLYKEALANDNQSKISEIEAFLQSIEDEKNSLTNKVAILSQELTTEKDRILRISADFDNFRKRTEKERLSLMTNVQGEVVESLLPVLDNFERAKVQIKVETEGEEKINNSYQSIYKQFMEILISLGVEAVETVGNAFDPLLHEAIMREDSMEFEEGIIIQEFRKGFKLGERLLRPAMVKVSAGPGPAKPDIQEKSVEESGGVEASEESAEEGAGST